MKPSALDRINVARTVIYIETTLRDAARYHLFENNTAFERMQITLQFNQFLDEVLNGGGLTRYQVVCDDSNNTPYIIQNNQLVIDIYLWPVYTTEFIALNTIVMGADAEITISSNA
jgi:phage tail sheath protein FI